jgi:hypothetical protein
MRGCAQKKSSIRHVKPCEIVLDDEFRNLVPSPAPETAAALKQALVNEGCTETLIAWAWKGRLILLIGYNVFPTLQYHAIPFPVHVERLQHRGEARLYIIDYFLKYRMLTPLAASYYRGLRCREDILPKGGDRKSVNFRKSVGSRKSAKALAEVYGKNVKTIYEDVRFAVALDALAMIGGDRIKPVILSQNSWGTRGRVIQLAQRSAEEQRRKLKELLFTRKMPDCEPDPDDFWEEKITLPRRSMALLAEKLLGKLELDEAVEFREGFARGLQARLATERRSSPNIPLSGG